MSLDYNLTKMVNRDTHFPPETDPAIVSVMGSLNRKVHALIFGTIATQIGEITLANADEWFNRYLLWHRMMGWPDADLPFDREDVRNAAGLSTNVYPDLPTGKWLKRTWEIFEREQEAAIFRAASTSSQAADA